MPYPCITFYFVIKVKVTKGPSIKDVPPKGEGGGHKKCLKGDKGREGTPKIKNFMDGP